MGKLQLLESGSDTSEVRVVCSIPCFVCILLLFGLGSDEIFGETTAFWGKMVRVKQMILPGRITKMVGTVE